MKVVLLRHGEVDMQWNKKYSSAEFDRACRNYDTSPIKEISKEFKLKNKYNEAKIYISTLPRTKETAVKVFGENIFYKSELLNEVPLKSFIDTGSKLPLGIWNVMGRLQWFFNNSRQRETKQETEERAKKAILMLEENNEDCYVVTHGFYLKVLLKELEKEGFKIDKRRIKLKNLEEVVAVK